MNEMEDVMRWYDERYTAIKKDTAYMALQGI